MNQPKVQRQIRVSLTGAEIEEIIGGLEMSIDNQIDNLYELPSFDRVH